VLLVKLRKRKQFHAGGAEKKQAEVAKKTVEPHFANSGFSVLCASGVKLLAPALSACIFARVVLTFGTHAELISRFPEFNSPRKNPACGAKAYTVFVSLDAGSERLD
jgi:hypothetical protein